GVLAVVGQHEPHDRDCVTQRWFVVAGDVADRSQAVLPPGAAERLARLDREQVDGPFGAEEATDVEGPAPGRGPCHVREYSSCVGCSLAEGEKEPPPTRCAPRLRCCAFP